MIDRVERWRRRFRSALERHHRASRSHPVVEPPTDGGPAGLLLIQIDGLGFEPLTRAIADGLMPHLGRMRDDEPCRIVPLYAGVPSSTPAFQAELLYGHRGAVPAYSFVHRASDLVFRMSHRTAAGTIEAGLSGRPLLEGGSSYSNIYRGGAAVSRFSMSSLGWRDFVQASRPRRLPSVLATHAVDVVRTLALSAREVLVGVPQLVRAVVSGEALGAELHFLQSRVGISIVLREAITTLASIDMARGLPVIHLDLLGYDEWAHRRGPDSPEAMRSLRGIDRSIGRLVRAARRSHRRHYDVWVFSDHGQESTVPYVELHGASVAHQVGKVLRSHGYDHDDVLEPARGVQGLRLSLFGARLAESLVPGLDLTPRSRDPARATTTALGPLGHVYLPSQLGPDGRDALARDLVRRAGVPLVLAAEGDGAIAWREDGAHLLPDAGPEILGADHPHSEHATRDLVALCHHPDAGELVISGWSPTGRPVSFPTERGSHSGPGPRETTAFVCAPEDAPLPWDRPEPLRASDLRDAALRALEGDTLRPADRWARRGTVPSLRLLTYNVHGCVGLDGLLAPERIARVIARYEPDVVALQEVDVGRERSGRIDQARVIAEHLGMLMTFHPTFQVEREQFGDAVLARLPLRVVRAGRLPALAGNSNLEPRGAIWVEVDAGAATYQVVNTHLSLHPRERRVQVEALLGPDWLGAIPPGSPLVVCGDFNAGPGFPTVRAVERRLVDVQTGLDGHRPRRTWGGRWPIARIDHIFADPSLRILHVDVPATQLTRTASDHLPLYADIAPPTPDGR